MKRHQLEHVLRAASRIAEESDVLVIGSQSILGSFDEEQLPPEVSASIGVDVTFFDDPDDAKSDAVDGAIGEISRLRGVADEPTAAVGVLRDADKGSEA